MLLIALAIGRQLVISRRSAPAVQTIASATPRTEAPPAAPPPQPVPPPAFSPAYYRPESNRLFVRADVTYLRQDFSAVLPVGAADPWPTSQRFDFTVRTRQLSTEEWEKLRRSPPPYPQRDSVLAALRELTGEDHGERVAEWWKLAERYSP